MTAFSTYQPFLQDSGETKNTSPIAATKQPKNVADAEFDSEIRIIVLYIEVIVGAIGGACVCLWLWFNRKRKSRVNKLIFHVALSDLLVVFCACLPQLVWEYYDREWRAGEVFCKFLKYVASFAMMASNYMLVVLAVDRHQAIIHPLRDPLAVWKMALIGWATAAVFSIPQLVLFRVNDVTAEGKFENKTVCESIFRDHPKWVRQAYLTFIGLVVFYIPFIIIVACYVRIFLKIAGKASEAKKAPKKQSSRPGKILLQSSQNNSLSKAKIKILKMTVVILATFAICGLPYHILEMIYSYGDHEKVPSEWAAILGGMAVANSAVNPFVFLAFNATRSCINGLFPFIKLPLRQPVSVYESNMSTCSEYIGNTTAMTDITRLNANLANKDKDGLLATNGPKKPIHMNKCVTYQRVDSEDMTEYNLDKKC